MKKFFIFCLINLFVFSMDIVKLESVDEILKPKGEKIKKITYDLNGLSLEDKIVQKKKENFINFILPSILIVKEEIEVEKKKIKDIFSKSKLDKEDSQFLETIYLKYKTEIGNKDELLKKLETVPVDLAIAQAIIESGWGTSRFSKEGNNVYGIWSFNKNENRIKAFEGKRGGESVYLRKYANIYYCVKDYFYTLSIGANYENLREKLLITNDSLSLSETLEGYSEIREEYVARLKSIIKYNDLSKYKEYKLEE